MKKYLIPGLALALTLAGCKNFCPPQLPADDLSHYTEGLPFEMAQVQRPTFKDFTERITEYGARGDGHYDNTSILYYEEISYPRTGAGIDTGWLQELLSTPITC